MLLQSIKKVPKATENNKSNKSPLD